MSVYYCYSYPQKEFLQDAGERMVASSVHPGTLKKFWMFERNDRLDKLLERWSKEHPRGATYVKGPKKYAAYKRSRV